MIKLLTTLKAHLQIHTCKEGNAPYFDSGVQGFYLLSRIRLQGWSCFVSTLSLSPWPEFVFQRDKRSCFPLPGSCLSFELWKSATIITFLLRCYPISSLSRRFGPAWPPLSLPRLFRGLFPGDLALSSSYGLLGFPRSEQDCAGLQELLLQSGDQRE